MPPNLRLYSNRNGISTSDCGNRWPNKGVILQRTLSWRNKQSRWLDSTIHSFHVRTSATSYPGCHIFGSWLWLFCSIHANFYRAWLTSLCLIFVSQTHLLLISFCAAMLCTLNFVGAHTPPKLCHWRLEKLRQKSLICWWKLKTKWLALLECQQRPLQLLYQRECTSAAWAPRLHWQMEGAGLPFLLVLLRFW